MQTTAECMEVIGIDGSCSARHMRMRRHTTRVALTSGSCQGLALVSRAWWRGGACQGSSCTHLDIECLADCLVERCLESDKVRAPLMADAQEDVARLNVAIGGPTRHHLGEIGRLLVQ